MNKTKQKIIKIDNSTKIIELLEKGQGKAKERTVTIQDIQDFAKIIEKNLNYLPKRLKKNLIIKYLKRETFAQAYKWTPQSTSIIYKYDSRGDLGIIDISRSNCRGSDNTDFQILIHELKDEQKNEIKSIILDRFLNF